MVPSSAVVVDAGSPEQQGRGCPVFDGLQQRRISMWNSYVVTCPSPEARGSRVQMLLRLLFVLLL